MVLPEGNNNYETYLSMGESLTESQFQAFGLYVDFSAFIRSLTVS